MTSVLKSNLRKGLLLIMIIGFIIIKGNVYAQTSRINGNWHSAATWNTGVPGTGWTTVNIFHNVIFNGSYQVNGSLNIENGGYLTVTENLSNTGGSHITVKKGGTLIVYGNVTLNARLNIHRGATVIIEGNTTIVSSENIIVAQANSDNLSDYADLIIKGNLISSGGGDITINRNGRVAIFGNISNTISGGTTIRVNSGGQVYIHGNINLSEGGNTIINNNPQNPYGLYVHGSISNPNSTVTTNIGTQQDMINSNPSFAEWVGQISGGPLPVILLNFNIQGIPNNEVLLKWSTASEKNNNYYIVQRSRNASQWHDLDVVKGKGNSSDIIHYTYIDKNPLIGTCYYRLIQIDFDGTSEAFKPSIFKNTSSGLEVMIFPNPTSDLISINFLSELAKENGVICLSDLNGHTIKTETLKSNSIEWNISHLPEGIYLLKIYSTNGKTSLHKIVKK